MNLNKKQVKAFLEVLSSDETRPVLTHAKIDTYEGRPVLVATDAYKLTAITLTDAVLPIMGYLVPRTELVKWYKLASAKDYLTDFDLEAIAVPEEQVGNYPKWQNLMPAADTAQSLPSIRINADYMQTMQTLADCSGWATGMEWSFYGSLAPIIARHNQNIYLVMPLKK